MRGAFATFRKDLIIECRTGVQLLPFFSFSVLFVSFLGLGVASFVSDQQLLNLLFHPLAWGAFLLSGSMTLLRAYESDREAETIRMYFLLGVSPSFLYLAKVLFLAGILFLNHLLSALLLAAVLNVSLSQWFLPFCVLAIVVALGYSALGAFIGGLMLQHHHRGVLLPIALLPLLFPMFFAVLEVSISLAYGNGILGAGGWLSLIIALSTAYLALGVLLFDLVVRE